MTTSQRGGYRPGSGRRAADGATNVKRVTVTLTEDDHARLRRLGGSPWVRRQIRAADQPSAEMPADPGASPAGTAS